MTREGDMAAKPQQGGGDEPLLRMVGSFDEMRREGWVPFTLGPLYVHGRLDFDVIARFACEYKGGKVEVATVSFEEFPILLLPGFEHTLQAMTDTAYPAFAQWLQTVEVIDRERKNYFRPLRTAAALQDPFMRYINITTPRPELLDLWSVASMHQTIVPETHVEVLPYPLFRDGEAADLSREEFLRRLPRPTSAPLMIQLIQKPAHVAIAMRGRALLKE